MTEQYMPTTEEVRDSYRYSNQRPDICGKDFGIEFDHWLAKRDAEVAAKAWDELAEYVAYVTDSAEGEYFKSQNPYRKELD